MKFNCDSCGQRYAISDEKAQGKVLKIRCRKCSHVIVVRGAGAEGGAKAPAARPAASRAPAQGSERPARQKPAPEATPARPRRSREAPALDLEPQEEADRTRMMPASSLQDALAASREPDDDEAPPERDEKTTMMSLADLDRAREAAGAPAAGDEGDGDEDEGWYAVIAGKQQGPFDDADFDAKVAAGKITERTYVWREGMDDWRPAKAVPILAARFAPDDAPAVAEEDHPLDTLAESVGPLAPADAPAASRARAAGIPPEDDAPDAQGTGRPTGDDALDALFEDIPEAAPADDPAGGENALDEAIHDDPFSLVPDAPGRADEPARENTAMFILASGVNKRKSPVRIAAFVLGFVGVIGAMGYLVLYAGGIKLSSVLPMVHPHRTAGPAGPTDAAAAAKLRAELMGGGKAAGKKGHVAAHPADADTGAVVQKEKPQVPDLKPDQKAALAALYGDKSRGALAIKIKSAKGPKVDSDKSPIDPKIIAQKIGANQRAFQGCVQQELRRNPKFKGGRVTLTLTVAPSGVVTHSQLDRRDLADTDVGSCITGASKRIVFPSFAGDEPVDFEIPLVLSTGY